MLFSSVELVVIYWYVLINIVFLKCSNVDPHHIVDVIDVREQVEIQMTLEELVEHFAASPRTRLLNMLSLEFSQTRYFKIVGTITFHILDFQRW